MSNISYRPELDTLRAIAITSVFLFHLDKTILPGGFVGVDIFFVISGYLITSIIIVDIKRKKFRFMAFYQRRIARIFPALATVTVTSLFCANYIYTNQDFASAGAVVVAAMLFIANIKMLFQGSYFEISPDAQPFLHYWSLSVEEQYYAIFPAILLVLFLFIKSQNKINHVILLITVISLFLSFLLTQSHPVAAFYLLPTRAWEIMAGSFVAFIHLNEENSNTTSHDYGEKVILISIVIIISSFFLINERLPFPGYIASIPVIGAALFIYARYDYRNSLLGKLIISRPFIYIGAISYSLYLWHWPVFSFINYELYMVPDITRCLLKIFISLILSIFSYHLIEKPARSFLNQPHKKQYTYIFFIVSTLMIVLYGFYVRYENYVSAESWQVKDGGIVVNKGLKNSCILLMGDSNASMYGKSIKSLAKKNNIKANIISVDAGDPLPDSTLWNDSIYAIINARPNYVVFAASWSSKINSEDKRIKLAQALRKIENYTNLIILITQPPILPEQATRKNIRKADSSMIMENKDNYISSYFASKYLKSLENEKIIVLDIEDIFTNKNSSIKIFNNNGDYLYQDSKHLSGTGANLVINSYLMPILTTHSIKHQICAPHIYKNK